MKTKPEQGSITTPRVATYLGSSWGSTGWAAELSDRRSEAAAIARKNDLVIDPCLDFSDAPFDVEPLCKRERGLRAMLRAWDNQQFDVLIVDQISRLGRDRVELAKMRDRIAKTNVRVITLDGLDSARPSWVLIFGIATLMSADDAYLHQFRIRRGLISALNRDRMIGRSPYGLRMVRHYRPDGLPDGMTWEPNPTTAPIVREMFARRADGTSLAAIARDLNRRGIARPATKGNVGAPWRPQSISALLANSIFKGVFVLNGARSTRGQAQRRGLALQEQRYDRPRCRLVSDELWEAANRPRRVPG